MQAVPQGGNEAVLKRGTLLQAYLRDREKKLRARTARPRSQSENRRIRAPVAREAEGEAYLRRTRESVPVLLREGRPAEGRHRRKSPGSARAALGQRSRAAGFCCDPRAGQAGCSARPCPCEWQESQYSFVPGCRGARG